MTGVKLTGQERCETIAAYFKEVTGEVVSPGKIWALGYRGELWHVFELHEDATWFNQLTEENKKECIKLIRPLINHWIDRIQHKFGSLS